MPTVMRVGPYSFVFFSSDRGEPPHIHVKSRPGDCQVLAGDGFAGQSDWIRGA